MLLAIGLQDCAREPAERGRCCSKALEGIEDSLFTDSVDDEYEPRNVVFIVFGR